MKATEFCYWLQGALELGEMLTMSRAQVSCMRKHMALVRVHRADGPPEATAFVGWLEGVLDMMDSDQQRAAGVLRIKERLDAVFEHAIDKTYENSEELNMLHNPPYGEGMRC